MKKTIILGLAVLLNTGALCNLHAAAREVSNRGRDYMVGPAELSAVSCGAYLDTLTRDVDIMRMPESMRVSKIMAYVGYDVTSWLTPYLTLGQATTRFDFDPSSSKLAYGGGLQFNFMDHEVPDPTLLEDRIRLNGNVQYTRTGAEDQWGNDLTWGELESSLTVSIVNDLDGNIQFMPDSIAIFLGPMYSGVQSGDIKGGDSSAFGFLIGLEVFYTQRVSLSAQYNKVGEDGFAAGLNVRF